MTCFEGGVSCC